MSQMRSLSSMFDAGSMTHIGNVRQRNEDSYLARGDIGLWAVADGMGGHQAGDLASQLVIALLDAIDRSVPSAHLLEQCEAALFKANQDILAMSETRHGATIGTTVAILLVRDAHFACLWAGDSRVYGVQNGAIRQISRDHTEVEDLIAAGALSRQDAEGLPNNVITRAVGVTPALALDVVTGPIEADDIFVICSDGLTRHLSDDEICQFVMGRNAQASCDAMVELALQRGGLDNVTVVVVRLLPDVIRPAETTNAVLISSGSPA
jgi:protein phosphatase